MKNVLITGGAGFIGSNFVRYILASEPEVRVYNLDILSYAGSLENLNSLPDEQRHVFVQGDICDRALVDGLFARYGIDTVVHFAAETHVDRSIVGPGQFIQTNVVGTFTLIEAARNYWANRTDSVRFHHVSTDEVFGTLAADEPAWQETAPYAPNSPYSASKAASDHLVRSYHHTYGLPVSITNCSNNYGPYQFPEKLIPLIILNALEGRDLPIYGDGRQVRDWLYVEDHCDAIYRVLTSGKDGETYNIGGNNQPANIEVVSHICDYLDECLPKSPHRPHARLIRYVDDRPGHDRRYAMDTTKIETELGWKPRHTLTTGLQKTIDWYLGNKNWIDVIRKQQNYQRWIDTNYGERSSAPHAS
jgi:dTDP-glucose 4,6-dehydratase